MTFRFGKHLQSWEQCLRTASRFKKPVLIGLTLCKNFILKIRQMLNTYTKLDEASGRFSLCFGEFGLDPVRPLIWVSSPNIIMSPAEVLSWGPLGCFETC